MYLIYPASDASLHWTQRWKYYYYAYHGKTQKTERNHVRLHMRDNSLVVPRIPVPRPQTFWLRTLAVDMVVAFSNKSRYFGANPGVFFWSVRYSLTTSGLNCPCTSKGQRFSCK